MNIMYPATDIMEQHGGKYVVTIAMRDDRGFAIEFSIVKICDTMNEAVSLCETLCEYDMDSVVIPCLSDDQFDNEMTPTETAYFFRGLFNKQRRSKNWDRKLTFDEVAAIFSNTM